MKVDLRGVEVEVPQAALEVLRTLQARGHRAFFVGGCVRDWLRGGSPQDVDVATSARPEEVQGAFRRTIPTGVQHGTVTVVHRGAHLEVTTFRSEDGYVDGRRPGAVRFEAEVEQDLSRRDFTINAMAWDPGQPLVDPFGGQVDLQGRLVRCVGEPLARFREDGLRPLRAVRFATVLDFALDAPTAQAIPQALDVFRKVALERVQQELQKLLLSPGAARGVELLAQVGLLAAFFPEAHASAAQALSRLPRALPVRLAALLAPGDALRARATVLRLKFPARIADETAHLLSVPALPPDDASEAQLRRWLAQATVAATPDVLRLHDALGASVGLLEARLLPLLASPPPLSARQLALDGAAIMRILQVPPSPRVGEATRALVEAVLDDPALNTPERLTKWLESWKTHT